MASKLSPAAAMALQDLEAEGSAPLLRIEFSADAMVTKSGIELTREAADTPPALSLATSLLANGGANKKYIAVSVDIEAPFPSFSFLSPILHGAQTDLVPKTDGASNTGSDNNTDTAWTPLISDVEPVMQYIGPNPPPFSGPHRYVFILYEQPEGMDADYIRKRCGWDAASSRASRMNWDLERFEDALGLSGVKAMNFFTAKR